MPALDEAVLTLAFSRALDVGEGKPIGHAERVCFIATSICEAMECLGDVARAAFYGALFHDVGVTNAAASVCRELGIDEEAVFGNSPLRSPEESLGKWPAEHITMLVRAVHQHAEYGTKPATSLHLPADAVAAVRHHHEKWDGDGFPDGLRETLIPLAARIVSAADMVESLISAEPNSLLARRNVAVSLSGYAGRSLDPEIVNAVRGVMCSDSFWLQLQSERPCAGIEQSKWVTAAKGSGLLRLYSETFADLADSKSGDGRHSLRAARLAKRVAEALGLTRAHAERIELAGVLHDVGVLGVPARVLSKPEILGLSEMELVRRHPTYSMMVVKALPGLEDVSEWVHVHHERPDGKGYPQMLSAEAIPLEGRILGLAETYVALTSKRPHRAALSVRDAKQVLRGSAGTQLDKELVDTFCSLSKG